MSLLAYGLMSAAGIAPHQLFSKPLADNSSGAIPSSLSVNPVGDTYRGIGSSWFNQNAVERENFMRSEQASNNQFVRDMEALQRNQVFNAQEAQKARDFEEHMSSTAYQRAMADMQVAGLNPVLAFQQGGASTPSASAATSSGGTSSTGYRSSSKNDPLNAIVGTIAKIVAGCISAGATTSSAAISAASKSLGSTTQVFNSKGRLKSTTKITRG